MPRYGMKLLSFDIEISDVFELRKYEDMDKYAPFHISVAATAIHSGEERIWYSEEEGRPALNMTQFKAYVALQDSRRGNPRPRARPVLDGYTNAKVEILQMGSRCHWDEDMNIF